MASGLDIGLIQGPSYPVADNAAPWGGVPKVCVKAIVTAELPGTFPPS